MVQAMFLFPYFSPFVALLVKVQVKARETSSFPRYKGMGISTNKGHVWFVFNLANQITVFIAVASPIR
jgi:hypothetical protein